MLPWKFPSPPKNRRPLTCLPLTCLPLTWLVLSGGLVGFAAAGGSGANGRSSALGEWRAYAADPHGSRYAPLDQIRASNFSRLRVAWTWNSVDQPILDRHSNLKPGPNEGTPLMVRGVLYVSTGLCQVAAIDARTGKTLWVANAATGAETRAAVHRGVGYWEGRGVDGKPSRRILIATLDSFLLALDAETGSAVREFGVGGRVDLLRAVRRPVDRRIVSVTSPPTVCGDTVVVGGAVDDFQSTRLMPPGDVQGFDARTGKRLWVFHTVPQAGEFGNDTWEDGSWRYTGNTNVWTCMTADPELGYVYLPVSTPTNDWYGGHRPGAGLFGESIVCLNARTGKRVWHYQFVHHGLWDYDPPCAPNLLDITLNGKRVKAVVQVTKQAFCFAFDRVTGKPLWPIEEKPVAPTTNPGDRAWPTQPFPTRPAPFDRQGISDETLIDYTPELHQMAKEELKNWNYGPLYTPPTTRKTILMPGWVGGASWAGAATDPETGMLYVPSISNPMWLRLAPPDAPGADLRLKIGENGYRILLPNGLPLVKGPYGRVTGIDMNSGDHRFIAVQGSGPRNHPALKALNLPPLGIYHRTYCMVTKSLLITTQEGGWFNEETPTEPAVLRAYNKRTGEFLAEAPLPAHPTGAPITCMVAGKQLIVVPTGGNGKPARLIALRLP